MKSNQAAAFQNRHFVTVDFHDGDLIDLSDNEHPTRIYGWGCNTDRIELGDAATHFGFLIEGEAELHVSAGQSYHLQREMFFTVPGPATLVGGQGVVFSRLGFRGVFGIGGPIEQRGRLRYIDGCSDSLLIPPVVKGDPCLNHLHFPQGIDQTRHTHPSIRVGIVARGQGRCVVPENEDGTGQDMTIPLIPGQVFLIPTDGQHSFFTDQQTMDIIAYHPDSDTGPDHDDHPMINRTIVDGVSATQVDQIRTKTLADPHS